MATSSIPGFLKPFETLGAKVVCEGNSCTITGPGGDVSVTLDIAAAKEAALSLASLMPSGGLTTGAARLGTSAKKILLGPAERFGAKLVELYKSKKIPIQLLADLTGANLEQAVNALKL